MANDGERALLLRAATPYMVLGTKRMSTRAEENAESLYCLTPPRVRFQTKTR